MKKIIFISLLIFCASQVFSQTIILKDGTAIGEKIESVLSGKVFYYKRLVNGERFIWINEIKEVYGKMEKGRVRTILRNNPNVKFISDEYSGQIASVNAPDVNIPASKADNTVLISSANFVESAGKKYMAASCLSIVGSACATLGGIEGQNELVYIGVAASVVGLVINIIGHSDLINAGKLMKQEKRLSIVGSQNGIGLAFKF